MASRKQSAASGGVRQQQETPQSPLLHLPALLCLQPAPSDLGMMCHGDKSDINGQLAAGPSYWDHPQTPLWWRGSDLSTSSSDINAYAKIPWTSNSPGVRAAGCFLRCFRSGWLTLKNTQIFTPLSQHTKSSSVHLHVFFCSFPALTLILLMVKHLKHFKTKLFTFRYFFPLYEKNRFLAGIYLPTCSLAPQPKIFWNTFLFISELCCVRHATHFFFI